METFELAMKKNKKKITKKTVMISFIVTIISIVVVFLGIMGLEQVAFKNYLSLSDYYYKKTMVAYPNISLGSSVLNSHPFGGTYHAQLKKDILGISVAYDDLEATYDIRGFNRDHFVERLRPASDVQGATSMAYSSKKSLKSPLFFNPNAIYGTEAVIQQPAQELIYVPQMTGQLVEVGLSFDKRYSLEDIPKMIPSSLKINWLWIGSETELNPSDLPLGEVMGWTPRTDFLEQSYEEFNDLLETTYADYKKDKSVLSDSQKLLMTDMAHYLEEANGDLNKARFGGVILTGKAEDFDQLSNADWIYASSIGVSILNQPYYDLNKE